ncbi:hypothetical protein H0H92_014767 [Tricholoma furcatifolium]|nr:hypothetical protein H0H92_014767 [Tricholoma furcatifolium]
MTRRIAAAKIEQLKHDELLLDEFLQAEHAREEELNQFANECQQWLQTCITQQRSERLVFDSELRWLSKMDVVNIAKPLTNRALRNMKPGVIKFLQAKREEQREKRLTEDRKAIIQERLVLQTCA